MQVFFLNPDRFGYYYVSPVSIILKIDFMIMFISYFSINNNDYNNFQTKPFIKIYNNLFFNEIYSFKYNKNK